MEIVTKFLDWVLALLPHSPFASFLDELETLPYLGYVNYFFPVGACIKIGEAWLVAVSSTCTVSSCGGFGQSIDMNGTVALLIRATCGNAWQGNSGMEGI